MTTMTVLAHHLGGKMTKLVVDITPADAPAEPCDSCTDSLLHGVHLDHAVPEGGMIGPFERCDECARFPGDLEAAAAVAFIVGGVAHFNADCEHDEHDEAIPGDPHQTCRETICSGTDPWVTLG